MCKNRKKLHLFQGLLRRGIRRRLMLSSLILCICFLFIEFFVSSRTMQNLLIKEYYNQNQNSFRQAENFLDSIMEITEFDIRRLESDSSVSEELSKAYDKSDYKKIYDSLTFLDSRLGSIFQRSHYVNRYILIGSNGFVLNGSLQNSARYMGDSFDFNHFYSLLYDNGLQNTSGFSMFTAVSPDSEGTERELLAQLSDNIVFVRELKDKTDSLYGLLLLTFDTGFLSDIFSTAPDLNDIRVFDCSGNLLWTSVQNPDQVPLSHTAPAAGTKASYTVRQDGRHKIMKVDYQLDAYNLLFENRCPLEKILETSTSANLWFLLFLCIILCLILPVSLYFSHRICVPLRTLAEKLNPDLHAFTPADFQEIMLPRHSLFSKLFFYFFLTAILPNIAFILLLAFTNYHNYQTAMERYTIASIQQTKWNLDRELDNLEQISINLSYDWDIDSMIKQNDFSKLEASFNDLRLTRQDLLAFDIIDNDGNSIFESSYYDTDLLAEITPDILAKMEGASGKLTFTGTVDTRPNHQVLVFSRPFYSLARTRQTGFTVYLIAQDSFNSILEKISPGKNGHYFILDQNCNIIACNNSSSPEAILQENPSLRKILEKPEGTLKLNKNGQNSLAFFDSSDAAPFKVAGIISLDELSLAVVRQLAFQMILLLVFILIVFLISCCIALSFTRPLKKLQQKMILLSCGDFNVSMPYTGKDEIGMLAFYFNDMAQKLNKLISENYQAKIRENELRYLEKEAQLNALQQQINPHFLYNTLESIKWMAYMNGAIDASNMATALGKFFKGTITKGQNIITVQQETDHLNTYLYIQKLRYENRFDVQLKISEEAMSCKIIKLVLQPIVENAIVHGIENMKQGGLIIIEGFTDENQLHFRISDNGAGMDSEQLEALRSRCQAGEEPQPNASVGIVNVYRRLFLYYEGKAEFTIDSRPALGTNVTIQIPIEN